MVAPLKKHRAKPNENKDAPRPVHPKLIQCAACGYDLPPEQHPRNDRLLLLDTCPKCHGFAWELIDERTVIVYRKPSAVEPCPNCQANRAGLMKSAQCETCGMTLKDCRKGGYRGSGE